MIEVYIYGSQWNDKNYLLFGMYDGVIDTEIEKPEKIDFMKCRLASLKIQRSLRKKI